MYTQPMIFPLDLDGEVYILQDENGNTVGTGSRAVCEVLKNMLIKRPSPPSLEPELIPRRTNLRAAIAL